MRETEFKRLKYFVLIATFIATGVITFLSLNFTMEMPTTTTMDSATLPVVMMQTENGTLFNELHGYTSDVDASLLNGSVTPIPDDKKQKIVINNYGEQISKLSYKIRKLDDMSLLEDTTVSTLEAGETSIGAVLNIKNLIDKDTEYLLEICITTEEYSEISYYTKIISSNNIGLQTKIDFVLIFNSCTFNKNRLDEISSLLETKSTGDNTNFGKVNINSTKAQIGWGDINPKVEKTIIPTIKEINSEVASIYLEYSMAAQGITGSYDSYNVDEYFRIRQTASSMYLLNYEREANQVFDSENDLSKNQGISLGITSTENYNMKCSSKGNFSCFVTQGVLWCLNDKDNTFTRIFSFEAEESDNVRELFDMHNIKIMDVNDEGNVNFIVYGYMNRGKHEGETGVSLCTYNYEENQVHERMYFPVSVPYDELQENVGEVAYISDKNVFYFLIDGTLYSIDLTSKEIMVEISGLTDETYAVSEDGTSIAYSLNGKVYDTDVVRIFNMATGSDHQIKANEGDKLKVLGYIKNDCIIGMAHASDILVEVNGCVTFPMYKLNIMDNKFNVIKEYQIDGVYVSSASVEGMRINLTRVVKNNEGNYESTSIDQLMNREENITTNGLILQTATTELRKKEVYIKPMNTLTNLGNVSSRTSRSVIFVSGETIKLDAKFEESGRYYVYGYGRFQGSFTSLAKAVSVAYETYGTVVDSEAQYIWKRYKDASGNVSQAMSGATDANSSLAQAIRILMQGAGSDVDASAEMASGMTAIDIINKAKGSGHALNLKGVTVENILYYISIKKPVIGRTGGNSYVLITGYDSKTVTYFDITSGKSVTVTLADANKLFTQWGNVFITYK